MTPHLNLNWVYLAIALLAFIVIVIAISLKKRVKLGFGSAVVEVGEDKTPSESKPGEAGKNINIANQSTIDRSKVNIQVGNSVSYHSPGAREGNRPK